MAGKSQLTEASHRSCYETTDVLSLPGARKEGIALAEISLAECDDGWRASHGFGFTGGDGWGSWSPVFAAYTAHPTRQEAILAEAEKLLAHITKREGKEPDKIREWLRSLDPDQADMFASIVAEELAA
ncbi:MAG: hypothetical protein JWR80_9461 [Bradyrhizobium sp.]|nr:hypothetical protein [Bradyrhizobium sp.]